MYLSTIFSSLDWLLKKDSSNLENLEISINLMILGSLSKRSNLVTYPEFKNIEKGKVDRKSMTNQPLKV